MTKFGIGVDDAIAAVLEGKNVFVTGPGGSGKSYTIKTIQALYANTTLTVAPTGVSALNVDAVTAHRAFGLAFGVSTESEALKLKARVKKLLKSKALERIIIDEVSMFRADKLWEMDLKCREARKKPNVPFGGLQVIMFGDFFQNGPVLTPNEEDLYYQFHDVDLCCFSKTWEELDPYPVLLEQQYRQKSIHFSSMLNCLRRGDRVEDIVNFINTACYDKGNSLDAITLTTTNALAEKINRQRYAAVQGEERTYLATIRGDFSQKPVPEEMPLKVGAKVMVTVNDPNPEHVDPEYVNGSLGVITKLLKDSVEVLIEKSGEVVNIGHNTWENVEYIPKKTQVNGKTVDAIETVVIGSYKALPIRLGWAVTIHKAQGLTLDALNVDFGYGAFAPGMAYVALSRATTAKGLRVLRKLRFNDIIVDKRVVRFYQQTFPGKF